MNTSAEQNESLQATVAIIGCGPVGALCAILLGRAGIKTIVVEREAAVSPLPRAVHIDHEMMRLFQSVGLAHQLAAQMRETQGHLHVGADHGVIRYLGTVGRPRPFGWANDYFFYQPEFETTLRECIAGLPDVTLRLGASVESFSQDQEGVSLAATTREGPVTIRARWAIACDGARSTVRKSLGIELVDLEFEESWLVVDAEVEGPIQFPRLTGVPLDAQLQELSVMMCDPIRPTTLVPGRGIHRRWEFMLLPADDVANITRPDRITELLEPWLAGVPHRVVRSAIYQFHGLVADQWQCRNVFLAGDAAHQTPPFFGQGMCHGMRDVANLAWKLELVEAGQAPLTLLSSYQSEREPHVRKVISAAIDAGRYICILDPAAAQARDARLRLPNANSAVSTAAELIPPISAGVVASTPYAGERFIQPWLKGGGERQLLDDITGIGWRLFLENGAACDEIRQMLERRVPALSMSVVNLENLDDDGTLAAWFARRGAWAALVRPDFYVFGIAESRRAVDDLIDKLQECLFGAVHPWPAHEKIDYSVRSRL